MSAEVQAVSTALGAAKGGSAYLNLESGDCHGDASAVRALVGECLHDVRVISDVSMCVEQQKEGLHT